MQHAVKHILHPIMLFCVTIIACTNNQTINPNTGKNQADTAQQPFSTSPIQFSSDTLAIYRKAAVFYEPDSFQIEKSKKAVGENDFYTGVEDYAYYLNASHDFLDSAKLPVLDARGKKVLAFIGKYQTKEFVRLDTLSDLWGIYFFDPAKEAKQVEITMIEEEYKNYFK